MYTQLRALLKQSSILTSVTAIAALLAQPVIANPLGGDVVAGTATITTPVPSTLLIDQSTDRAIINWNSFNVDAGEITQFVVPDAESWTLNRVVGSQSPSLIYGSIESNGNVVIVNPDGMHFGAGAVVDVNRLVATTADTTNDDFMAGKLSFGIAGNPNASIVNEGTISAANYGFAALVAPSVRNSGIITARLGTVGLSAGNTFTIDPYGDGLIKLALGDEIAGDVYDVATGEPVSDLVLNEGTLSADGGTVAMTAATARQAVNSVVNNTGVVEARSVGVQNGMIVLGGSTAATKPVDAPAQVVKVSGTLDASGDTGLYPLGVPVEGGDIQITGEVILAHNATLDASGTNDGGTILIGGDYLGGNIDAQEAVALGVEMEDTPIDTATLVVLDETVTISADATEAGDGGKVIVWSDDTTLTAADISARGGPESGDGGFIETSGKSYLSVLTNADASAANGEAGTWLMDPYDIEIASFSSGSQGTLSQAIDLQDFGGLLEALFGTTTIQTDIWYPSSSGSVIAASIIEAALNSGTSVLISTLGAPGSGDGHVTINADITKSSGGDAIFGVTAAGDVIVQSGTNFVSTSGALVVSLGAPDGAITGTNVGEFQLNGGALALMAEGHIGLTSSHEMPNLLIAVNPLANEGISSRDVNVSFGQDSVNFNYSDSFALFRHSAIKLLDDGLTTSVIIALPDLNVIFENYAVFREEGRDWRIQGVNSWGVVEGSALDGFPEILGGFQIFKYPPNEPPHLLVPVLEVLRDLNNPVVYYVSTSPNGVDVLDENLNPPVVEPPVPPAPEEEVAQDVLDPKPMVLGVSAGPEDGDNLFIGPLPPQTVSLGAELEFSHRALMKAKTIKEQLVLAKDLANLYAKYLNVAKLEDLAATNEYFRTQLNAAKLDYTKAGVDFAVGAFIDFLIEAPLTENLLETFPDMERNVAESISNTIGTMVEVILTGGGAVPGYIFDQTVLILEASIELEKSNTSFVNTAFQTTQFTVDALERGALKPEQAAETFEFMLELSEDYVGTLAFPSAVDAANKAWIISQLAIMKLNEGRIGRSLSDMAPFQRMVLQLGGEYVNFANSVASSFRLQTWSGVDRTLLITMPLTTAYEFSDLRLP